MWAMSDPADIARLKAEAAQAAAEAAAAKAAAAQAALDAALAASGDAGAPAASAPSDAAVAPAEPTAPGTTDQPTAGSPAPEAPSSQPSPSLSADVTGYAAQVQSGYAFSGATLPVGTYLDYPTDGKAADGDPAPVTGVRVGIPLGLMNRHALVAGATGTGKTRTLQLLAEGLSAAGVPVFLSDVKGDLTGLAEAGASSDKLAARTASTGQPWKGASFPAELLTLGGQGTGTPIRTTITDFGPVLLARVLGLNETQTSALQLVFHWADQQGLALLDLKDLRAVIEHLTNTDDGKEELRSIGGVSAATAGVILRQLATLESEGGDRFFGEPALDVHDLLRTAADGRGVISSLELEDIQSQGVLFSTFLMWLLGELFEILPEVGDPEKPTVVFFFDEAHLLFADATKAFLEAVTRTVRLIRSKGVGIVFITQSPTDVPDEVLAQLGSRVQHALRAHTPADAANLKKAVSTFPTSPLDLSEVLTSLGTGQAVVSVLDEKGRPAPVAPVMVDAPASVMGPGKPETVQALVSGSAIAPKYATAVDNESAYEILAKRLTEQNAAEAAAKAQAEADAAAKAAAEAEAKDKAKAEAAAQKAAEKAAAAKQREAERLEREAAKQAEAQAKAEAKAKERRQREIEKTIGQVGRQVTREITRSLLGNILRR